MRSRILLAISLVASIAACNLYFSDPDEGRSGHPTPGPGPGPTPTNDAGVGCGDYPDGYPEPIFDAGGYDPDGYPEPIDAGSFFPDAR